MTLIFLIKTVIAVASGIAVGLISIQIANLTGKHSGSYMVHEVLYNNADKGEAH